MHLTMKSMHSGLHLLCLQIFKVYSCYNLGKATSRHIMASFLLCGLELGMAKETQFWPKRWSKQRSAERGKSKRVGGSGSCLLGSLIASQKADVTSVLPSSKLELANGTDINKQIGEWREREKEDPDSISEHWVFCSLSPKAFLKWRTLSLKFGRIWDCIEVNIRKWIFKWKIQMVKKSFLEL